MSHWTWACLLLLFEAGNGHMLVETE